MYIAFCDGMLLHVAIHNNKATVISKQEIGTATIDFYNHFARYRSSPEKSNLRLSQCPDEEAAEIISRQPLAYQFFLDCIDIRPGASTQGEQTATEKALANTRNFVQKVFSDLDGVFSEMSGANGTNTLQLNKTAHLFAVNQFKTSFVLLNNRIIPVYSVKNLYEYLVLDFYHANFSPNSVRKIAVCPYCRKVFRISQRNNLYCSKLCKNKYIEANNKKNPYHSKYRYLQQYHNRQFNKLRKQMADFPQEVQRLQDAYNVWNEWAHAEYKRTIGNATLDKQETPEEFDERLKDKWKVLKDTARRSATGTTSAD